MTQQQPSGGGRRPPQYPESPGSSKPDYNHFAPGVGYTPPYTPPPAPPKGVYGRGKSAWQRYGGLRKRARADSMSWWWMKALQGVIFGGGPFIVGLLIMVANAAMDGSRLVAWFGAILLLSGLGIILRYALAPLTCKWIVLVPENRFCVVEDADHYTAEYLEPGRWIVSWRWHAKVHDYVDFGAVTANAVIADVVSGSGGPVLDMDVTVVMAFNPAHAEPNEYARLRKMTTREQFETMIMRDVRDIVRKHFRLLTADQQRSAVRNTRALEEVIADQLGHYRAMGLTLASSRPVMVYVRNAPTPQTPYPPPVYSGPWTQPPPQPAPSPYAHSGGYYGPTPEPPRYEPPSNPTPRHATPPPDPTPTMRHTDPPTIEHVHKPPDEEETPPPQDPPRAADSPSREDAPKVKKNAQDPLDIRRKRRNRE